MTIYYGLEIKTWLDRRHLAEPDIQLELIAD